MRDKQMFKLLERGKALFGGGVADWRVLATLGKKRQEKVRLAVVFLCATNSLQQGAAETRG